VYNRVKHIPSPRRRIGPHVLVSVVIPNWNGSRHLATCLDSLSLQTYDEREILVVDNGSTDDSLDLVRSRFSWARWIPLGHNYGFVGAVNAGIRASQGQVVALLNNDTEADQDWLSAMCAEFRQHPGVSVCATKLLLFDRRDTLHSAGDFYGLDCVPGNRGVWETDRGQYDQRVEAFGACGGAAGYRRELFDDIGLFDPRLYMYCEDVDLNLRATLAGHRCRFVPAARVYHKLSATGGGPTASYYCGRNFIEVALRNVPTSSLRRHWPSILGAQARIAVESGRHIREPSARARLRGQIAALRHLPATLGSRRAAQQRHRIRYTEFEDLVSRTR
jgi:GT2 family glycosyltransferase